MKDKKQALEEIRAICIGSLDTGRYGDAKLDHATTCILARIEWICRHALEDYDTPGEPPPTSGVPL